MRQLKFKINFLLINCYVAILLVDHKVCSSNPRNSFLESADGVLRKDFCLFSDVAFSPLRDDTQPTPEIRYFCRSFAAFLCKNPTKSQIFTQNYFPRKYEKALILLGKSTTFLVSTPDDTQKRIFA